MGKEAKRDAQKNELLTLVQQVISEKLNIDALRVSTSELSFPAVDDEGNEFYFNVKISVPRGKRNGNGYNAYDGYAVAEEYRLTQEVAAAKKAASAAKKEAEAKARAAKKEAKKVVKELNEKGFDKMVHEGE